VSVNRPDFPRSRASVAVQNDFAIAILRIAVGALFLIFAEYKVFGTEFVFGGGFERWIRQFLAEGSAYRFVVPFLRGFALGHARALALLSAYGELAIGISLVLGLWARAASLCGLVYMLSLLFSANYPGPHAVFWQYFGAALEHLVLVLCFMTFVMGDPERVFSVSQFRTGASTSVRVAV